MDRLLLPAVVLAVTVSGGCAVSFKDRRTPSGDFCSDMLVIPAGSTPDREHHRLQPVSSDREAKTEAQRLESLRKAACLIGGDAVIEAVNEEVRGENAQYVTVSSGTAVVWIRHANGEAKPISVLTKPTPPTPEPTPEPTAEASAEPVAPPAKSAKPGSVKPPKPGGTKPAAATSSVSAPDGGTKK
jgi:hypothetical protein